MKKISSLILVVIIIVAMVGCGNNKELKSDTEKDSRLKIFSSIYPYQFLVEEIGQEKVRVENIVPVGMDSHDFEPTGKEIAEIKESDILILNGSGMEEWGDKIKEDMDREKILTVSESIELLNIEESDSDVHDANHKNSDKDPHIWMSIKNMIKISEEIKNKMISSDLENEEYYKKNYDILIKELKNLDEKYEEVLKDRSRNTILVSHNAYSYLTKDYGINQVSVSGIIPLSEPSPKSIADIIDKAREEEIHYIFMEPLSSIKTVKTIADETGLEILTLNPLEGLTEEDIQNKENYISIMEKNLENLKKELVR